MAALYGKIVEYDSTREEWAQYEERLGHFFEANSITDAGKKRAVFLAVVGPNTYKLLSNLIAPSKPGDKSYADLVAALRKHFNPTPSVIVERFKFHSRSRKPGESVATFTAELRRLSVHCKFEAVLEDMLRDRLVCGINEDALQKRLLAEPDLTYAKAVELAQALETAARNVQELKTKPVEESRSDPVNALNNPSDPKDITCFRCGKVGHIASKCRVSKDIVCHYCKQKGHMKKACQASRRKPQTSHGQKSKSIRHVDERVEDSDSDSMTPLHHVSSPAKSSAPPITVTVLVDGCSVNMEVDTGACTSLISEATYHKLWPAGRDLEASQVKLCTYSKEPLTVLGCCYVNMEYKGQVRQNMPLQVVEGCGPSLLGRNWIQHVKLDWHEINSVRNKSLQGILDRHKNVFEEGLGKIRGFQAKIHVDPQAKPQFHRPRSVPYALRSMVEEELDRLVAEGTLEPVETEWAAPIVPVLKHDRKSIRICGDFRVTVNPVSKLDNYPIPKVEDLFAKLEGSKCFTKLDLSQAYQQLPLEEESKKYVVVNTQRGLFRYTRLPFGIASAPGIFQRVMENLLKGIPGVVVFIDDILIARESEEANLSSLDEVLKRLQDANLRLKLKKCQFLAKSVDYLGHRIDGDGLHPLPDKVQAVQDAPAPKSVQELKSYLGLIAYYSKFLPNLSSTLYPLYLLLRKSARWKWGRAQQRAFEESKALLTSDKFLVHFDSTMKLSLACDASAYGVGAVLAHVMPDGSEKPIGYASRTLNDAERNYSQLEKEGLSCIFGIKKFHDYLFGRSFQLITDHKPLLGLLKEDKAVPSQASARIKRWSLFLSNYEYELVFRYTTAHGNADALSRLPLNTQPVTSHPPPELVLLTEHLEDSPITADQIRTWTRRDKNLSLVFQYISSGWPDQVDPELEYFRSKRTELSVHDGCILWGNRVLVPEPGREAVLNELHSGHPGISKMRALARMFVWWPGIDADIEKTVRRCKQCQEVQSSPPAAPLNPWKWPSKPWTRLHLDFAGPFQGRLFLVVVDAHSKWMEALVVSSTSSAVVITELRTMFARLGIPETIVTDNGTGFTSREFEHFLRENGIKHIKSAPYHPATNGLAERAVQVLKRGLKKVTSGSIESRLAKVLFSHRITPHCTTGVAPDELLLGRKLRTRLDLLRPDCSRRVEKNQLKQKNSHDSSAKSRTFQIGDTVSVKNFGSGPKWIPGIISGKTGPVSFSVTLDSGRERRCHIDHLKARMVSSEVQTDSVIPQSGEIDDDALMLPSPVTTNTSEEDDNDQPDDPGESQADSSVRHYPRRVRHPPERYESGLN